MPTGAFCTLLRWFGPLRSASGCVEAPPGQQLEGCRPVAGADGHGFVLSWSDERAPLDVIHCQLFFPTQPDASRKFSLPKHQLVSLLMDCSAFVGEKPDLPNAFWSWVLVEQNDAVADA